MPKTQVRRRLWNGGKLRRLCDAFPSVRSPHGVVRGVVYDCHSPPIMVQVVLGDRELWSCWATHLGAIYSLLTHKNRVAGR